ncbi:hypothetical protein BDZ97DRAFT_1918445 [Flammula alnicola]|nr:hypothetical protein BDZ97DRAFT_1918445 [Flammula alnicola]
MLAALTGSTVSMPVSGNSVLASSSAEAAEDFFIPAIIRPPPRPPRPISKGDNGGNGGEGGGRGAGGIVLGIGGSAIGQAGSANGTGGNADGIGGVVGNNGSATASGANGGQFGGNGGRVERLMETLTDKTRTILAKAVMAKTVMPRDRVGGTVTGVAGGGVGNLDVIQGLNDSDAGRLLLGWLAGQLPGHDHDGLPIEETQHEMAANFEEDANGARYISNAMRDSVLEPDEVLIIKDERLSQAIAATSQDVMGPPADYMPPSQLKKHAEYVNTDAHTVQREADLLRSRISQTKEASKKITHSIKLLQRSVYDFNTKMRDSEERLSEVSITADTTVAETINNSQGLLRDLGFSGLKAEDNRTGVAKDDKSEACPNDEDLDLEAARALVLQSNNDMSTLTAGLQESMEDLTLLRHQESAKLGDLQMEAERLQNALSSTASDMKGRRSSMDMHDANVNGELQGICDLLEHEVALRDKGEGFETDALENLLSELDEGYLADKRGSSEQREPAVEEILRHAWALDQAVILRLHENALDKALSALDSMLAPLQRVYISLSRLTRCAQEAEAILEAFAEELGDIYLDDMDSKESRSSTAVEEDESMEKLLKGVLNDLKDLRPVGSPPLLLLTQEDIVAELRSLKARSARVEASERAWADDLLHQYSIRPLHPALPQIYANSPLNTSPPFAFPAHVRELEAKARRRAAELQGLANSLEEEVRETFAKESNTKRLGVFADKWCRTQDG